MPARTATSARFRSETAPPANVGCRVLRTAIASPPEQPVVPPVAELEDVDPAAVIATTPNLNLCPHCGAANPELKLYTSFARYFACRRCCSRWQISVEQKTPTL